jgi:hypothetical protein
MEAVMDNYELPDNEITALKRFHKTLKVKREGGLSARLWSSGKVNRIRSHFF